MTNFSIDGETFNRYKIMLKDSVVVFGGKQNHSDLSGKNISNSPYISYALWTHYTILYCIPVKEFMFSA